MKQKFFRTSARQGWRALALAGLVWVAACGGGGGGAPAVEPPAAPKAWQTAQLLELGAADAIAPQIAVDANGNAMAVWMQLESEAVFRFNIWAARYVLGSGWGPAELIETGTGSASDPQVAVDASGNAIAVWEQTLGTGEEDVLANRYVVGSGWGQAQPISNLAEVGESNEIQIAMDGAGNAMVVWRQTGSQAENFVQNLWFNRFSVSSGWGLADLVERVPGNVDSPQIASTPTGTAMAVWLQTGEAGTDNVFSSRYNPSTGWSAPELLEQDNTGDAFDPQIALHADGHAMAVWKQVNAGQGNIWANRYTPASGWGAPELIETDPNRAFTPQIAMDAAGNVVAVWEQDQAKDIFDTNIWANHFDGTRWGTAQKLETDDISSAGGPQVAVDASGNALAVWAQATSSVPESIWAARYVPGAGWSPPELLEANSSGGSRDPQIAINASGIALAVWGREVNNVGSIFANVFK
jgi:hypothetical protein